MSVVRIHTTTKMAPEKRLRQVPLSLQPTCNFLLLKTKKQWTQGEQDFSELVARAGIFKDIGSLRETAH
ncbi:hypothetical protein NDU88_008702 [Pleurodeles waltl]|uniref:Uncharacterized protein n=1 Tax=Pleurodeles waltl TaxID=8319 RepID=A0AAV7PR53_PLEWA|nr:hypothetical protein NDU88_008702 [Pleurodeles waltl]